jgi:hypothetical protein
MGGMARGPAKILPLQGRRGRDREDEVGPRRHPVSLVTWVLVGLGLIVLAVAIVLGIQIGRELVGWFRV